MGICVGFLPEVGGKKQREEAKSLKGGTAASWAMLLQEKKKD